MEKNKCEELKGKSKRIKQKNRKCLEIIMRQQRREKQKGLNSQPF